MGWTWQPCLQASQVVKLGWMVAERSEFHHAHAAAWEEHPGPSILSPASNALALYRCHDAAAWWDGRGPTWWHRAVTRVDVKVLRGCSARSQRVVTSCGSMCCFSFVIRPAFKPTCMRRLRFGSAETRSPGRTERPNEAKRGLPIRAFAFACTDCGNRKAVLLGIVFVPQLQCATTS